MKTKNIRFYIFTALSKKVGFKYLVMRNLIIGLFLLTACTNAQNNSLRNFNQTKLVSNLIDVPVLIVTGQSNAGSHGANSAMIPFFSPAKTSVYHWITGTKTFDIYDAAVSVHTGFETRTASVIDSIRNKAVYVININQGSLAISNWAKPSGSMWINLKNAIDTAFTNLRGIGYNPVVLSTIWLQGEQDATIVTPQDQYQTAISNFIDNYRALDKNLSKVPFVMSKLRTDMENTGDGIPEAGIPYVNTSFDNMVATKVNCATIDPMAIGATTVDGVHYNADGYIKIANAWAGLIPTSP